MKIRYKIILLFAITMIPILMVLNPFDYGYFPFPWNNMNDPYCWSSFQAFHDEPIDSLALNLHIRNEIAKYGWEYNIPWRGIEIDSGVYSTGIKIDGSWHGVYQLVDGNETQIGINLNDNIKKFDGITEVKSKYGGCA